MARLPLQQMRMGTPWKCSSCRAAQVTPKQQQMSSPRLSRRLFSSAKRLQADVEIQAAPEINFDALPPARVIPASPSYFTASPVFNDSMLALQAISHRYQSLPTVEPDQAPRRTWMKLGQFRGTIGETIAASKYSKILVLLNRLNRIHPQLMPPPVEETLKRYLRPGSAEIQKAKPGIIDEYGRSRGLGRRKESSARVQLVEGDGQVLVNGRKLLEAFPRVHDRESALWALKVTERLDKYNIFALVQGGGTTGQAESITLAVAKALLVQEPALKPVLRRAGLRYVRREAGREEEARPLEGKEEACMGKALKKLLVRKYCTSRFGHIHSKLRISLHVPTYSRSTESSCFELDILKVSATGKPNL